MNNQGWIKLHRSVQHCFLWSDKPYAKGQAWIDLLMLANYENKKAESGGKIVTYERGVVHVPILELANRWGWDRKKVSKFLKLLESDDMVTVNSTTHGTTVTIVNYDNFQDVGTTNVTTVGTTVPQPMVQPLPITKKEKKEKKEKNIYGTFNNVKLTDEEFEKLKEKFPDYQDKIDKLSEYIASKGKRYSSHYATILSWARKDEPKVKKETTEERMLRMMGEIYGEE